MERRVKVSLELCIQVYMHLSLEHIIEGPTILVMNHIYNRQMSYKNGVMTCRSTIDGIPLGEKLSTLSTEDFEQINDNNNDNMNATTKSVLRAISTTCKAMCWVRYTHSGNYEARGASGDYKARGASGNYEAWRVRGGKYEARMVIFRILAAVNRFSRISWKEESR